MYFTLFMNVIQYIVMDFIHDFIIMNTIKVYFISYKSETTKLGRLLRKNENGVNTRKHLIQGTEFIALIRKVLM